MRGHQKRQQAAAAAAPENPLENPLETPQPAPGAPETGGTEPAVQTAATDIPGPAQGPLSYEVGFDPDSKTVVLWFSRPVKAIGLQPADAGRLAVLIAQHARMASVSVPVAQGLLQDPENPTKRTRRRRPLVWDEGLPTGPDPDTDPPPADNPAQEEPS